MLLGVKEEDLASIKKILQTYAREYEVRAFGSRVSGNPKKFSDLDLVMVGNKKIPESVLTAVKNAFEESNLPFKVDVLDWADLNENFRALINQQCLILKTAG